MSRRALGKHSKAISDISGLEIPYKDLKTNWKGQRVSPEDYEPKQPQITPAKNVFDATALRSPRPDNDPEDIIFHVGFNYSIFTPRNERPNVGIKGSGGIGYATVSIS